jgi:hypothetical protein
LPTMGKKIGVLVVNWKLRTSIENRQSKILITKKKNNHTNIWLG